MSNLGGYQAMTTLAKKLGGPKVLVAAVGGVGYIVFRSIEAGAKKVVRRVGARNVPCSMKGQAFRATSDGDTTGLKISAGDEYRVLECDGDAILIEMLGDPANPYVVSGEFLRSVSDFPLDIAEPNG